MLFRPREYLVGDSRRKQEAGRREGRDEGVPLSTRRPDDDLSFHFVPRWLLFF